MAVPIHPYVPQSCNPPRRCDSTAKDKSSGFIDNSVGDNEFSQESEIIWEYRKCPRSFRIPYRWASTIHGEELIALFQGSHCQEGQLLKCSDCDRYYKGDLKFYLHILQDHPIYTQPAHRSWVERQQPKSFTYYLNEALLWPFEKFFGW